MKMGWHLVHNESLLTETLGPTIFWTNMSVSHVLEDVLEAQLHEGFNGTLYENESIGLGPRNDSVNSLEMMSPVENDGRIYQFPLHVKILLFLLYGVISLAAVVGNGLVLWVVSVSLQILYNIIRGLRGRHEFAKTVSSHFIPTKRLNIVYQM